MRFTSIMLLAACLQVSAKGVAQNITLSEKNAPLEKIFQAIKKQTGYSFLYSSEIIKKAAKVDLEVRNAPLGQVLKACFTNQPLTWEIEGKTIIVKLAANETNAAEPPPPIEVRGKIVNESNEPVAGVSINVKGTSQGTFTDSEGNFVLQGVQDNATLVISGISIETYEIKVAGKSNLSSIKVKTKVNELTSVVVGYGKQRVTTVTGSVSQINSDKITVAPLTNVTNTLAGQLPGLISKQTSGIPGADDASLNIRGFGSPLVIVDGIEANINKLDANQIESVSILKDGAASIYGARAGNGVILVTTKRGKNGKTTLTANASYTLQGSTNVIRQGTSAERAQYAVDQWLNSGKPANQVPYTPEEIQKYKDGTDPKYLNTDWYDAVIRRYAPQLNNNVSLSGGTEKIKYFGYFGANRQETVLKTNGGYYRRYNFQVNVDAKVNEQLSASMDVQYINETRFYPSGAGSVNNNHNFWSGVIYDANPSYPLTLPDKTKLSYAGVAYGNPLFATNSDLSGANAGYNNTTQFKGELRYDVKSVVGLNLKGTVIYRNSPYDSKVAYKQQQFYTYDSSTKQYTYIRSSQDPLLLSMGAGKDISLVQQYSLNYNRTFNNDHQIAGMLMYEYVNESGSSLGTSRTGFKTMALQELFAGDPTTATNSSSSYANGRISYIGRLNYSYQDRYMLETILRADASSRLPSGGRWGYFPSVSLGWNIAKEKFLESTGIFNMLKFRASYGASGYDGIANYAYLAGYQYDATYTLGNSLISGLIPTGLANPNLTWEKISIYNTGLDFSLWRNKLYGAVEYFYRVCNGIPGTRWNSLPSTFGATLPLENLNSTGTRGIELRLGSAGHAGKLSYDIVGNIAYSRSKWIHYDEPIYTDPDQIRLYKNSGRYTDRRIGYRYDQLFSDQQDVNKWPLTFDVLNNDNTSLRPGDVKYKDLNSDGIINWRDQTVIGKGATPHWTFGLNTSFQYGSFDLSALFQGAFDYTTYIDFESTQTVLLYNNYWNDRTNNANALVPRPSGSPTNYFYSDYRNHNTTYVRLKNMSLGYQLPAPLLNRLKISKLRVFVAGTNLFTVSSLSKYGVDPEMPEGYPAGQYYPQQYTMSFGCNLTF